MDESTGSVDRDAQFPQEQVPPSTEQSVIPRTDYASAVGKIAFSVRPDAHVLSSGELAELRRISADDPYAPVLWRLLLDLGLDASPAWINQDLWERRWATIMMGMAIASDLHDYSTPLGRALAESGWSQIRFVRLLRADGETLEKAVRQVATYLSSKSQKANWTDVAKLLFHQTGDTAKDIRLKIARTYYGTLYASQKE